MKEEDIKWLEEQGIIFNEARTRMEYPLENGGKIIAHFPLDGVAIIMFDIRGEMPDLKEIGNRIKSKGPILRTHACRSGSCEFKKNGRSALLWANEVSVDMCNEYVSLELSTKQFLGLETILYIEKVERKNTILQLLKDLASKLNLDELLKNENSMFCFKMSGATKRELDALIQECLSDAESSIVAIKAAEIGYHYCTDKQTTQSICRNFISKSQIVIAEDIFNCLTEKYDQKWTASYFAEKYGFSTTTVKKYFECVYGYEFKAYQIKVRMDRASELLRESNLSVGEIAQRVGYSTHAKFGAMFKEKFGVTPLEYRRASKIQQAL